MQLLGRCIIHEEINLQKTRALKNQEVNDLVQKMGGDPNEPQIIKEKRLGQLNGLWSFFDWDQNQGIALYDKRNQKLKMMSDKRSLQGSVAIDKDCYEQPLTEHPSAALLQAPQ